MYMREYWVQVHKSPIVYRYVDWTITVPLQMIEFNLILKAAGKKVSGMMFWKLLLGTVVMLLCGYLGEIAAEEHHNGAKQELPEHHTAHFLASGLQDQIKFDHLQWHRDGPIHIAVDNRRLVNLHPVFAHVHVMHASHQCDKSTDRQRCLPMSRHRCRLSEEKGRSCDHRNGNDPERDCHTVVWAQESIRWVVHWLCRRHG